MTKADNRMEDWLRSESWRELEREINNGEAWYEGTIRGLHFRVVELSDLLSKARVTLEQGIEEVDKRDTLLKRAVKEIQRLQSILKQREIRA